MIKENELVLCTVDKIEGTTVFIKTDEGVPGSIVFSEIAAGRIRNIREYVSPSKKIVCKVLKVLSDHIELSLRRVTGKEREEILERYKKQKVFENILKAAFPNPSAVIEKIKQKYDLFDFFEKVKANKSILDEFFNKSEVDILSKLILEKKEKEKVVKKTFSLKSLNNEGLDDLKSILLTNDKKVKINYLGSSIFSISAQGNDFKQADHDVDVFLEEIEKRAKEKKALFEIKEK